jgi:hypothetical protein
MPVPANPESSNTQRGQAKSRVPLGGPFYLPVLACTNLRLLDLSGFCDPLTALEDLGAQDLKGIVGPVGT